MEKTTEEQGLAGTERQRSWGGIIGRCMSNGRVGVCRHERQGCYRARQRLLRGLAALADGDGWWRVGLESCPPARGAAWWCCRVTTHRKPLLVGSGAGLLRGVTWSHTIIQAPNLKRNSLFLFIHRNGTCNFAGHSRYGNAYA